MRKLTILGILVLALVFAVNVLASTPDGMTPAEETVCDQLKTDGISKGLYGLCVAYCEAIDGPAEIIESVEDFDKSAEPPSPILLALYQNKMRAGDPQMPCVNYVGSCPVWTQEELNRIGTLGGTTLEDIEVIYTWGAEYFKDNENGNGFKHYAQTWAIHDKFIGYYFSDGTGFPNVYRKQYLTEAEYNACKQQLINHKTQP
jgi:hypothetical protein